MIRLYNEDFEGKIGEHVTVDGSDYHHVIHVMRHKLHDTIRLFHPRTGEWTAHLNSINKQTFVCELIKQVRDPLPTGRSIHLASARLKPDAWGWMLEKATELGATHIHPIITERIQHAHTWQPHKWQALMKGAAQQCERLDVPMLSTPQPLDAFLKSLDSSVAWHAALERSDASRIAHLEKDVGVVIGPEGGFSDYEKHMLGTCSHIKCVTLGPNILRAETAAISALTLMTLT